MTSEKRPYDPVKRGADLLVGAIVLVLSLPIQLLVYILVAIRLGRPVLFRQRRPGRDGRIFTILKFRSMLDIDEARGLVTDEQRLTPFGRTLRSTSLDELPALLNVLRGDMSLVGPRPLLESYLPLYTHEQARRHEVRPGITGLAQVSGRNSTTWEERFAYDVYYVDHRSARLDLWILWRTVRTVFSRSGVSADDNVTMHEFRGSQEGS